MTDNTLTVTTFNDNNEALDSNGNRIVIYNNGTSYVLKPSTVLSEGDKLVAVIESIND